MFSCRLSLIYDFVTGFWFEYCVCLADIKMRVVYASLLLSLQKGLNQFECIVSLQVCKTPFFLDAFSYSL